MGTTQEGTGGSSSVANPNPRCHDDRLRKLKSSSSSSFRLRSPSLNSLRLRRTFDVFDKNGDGFITVDELGQALHLLGLDADLPCLRSITASFIRPGNTGLLFSDFEALHRSLHDTLFLQAAADVGEDEEAVMSSQEESDLSEAFKVFDMDGDGFISAKELQVVLAKLGFPEAGELKRVEQMIVSADSNRDGRVDFFEFKDMMRRSVLVCTS